MKPKFQQFLAAFAAAGTVFTIAYIVVVAVPRIRGANNGISEIWAGFVWGGLWPLALSYLVIMLAIIGLAYPLERLIQRKGYGLGMALALYGMGGFGLTLIGGGLVFWSFSNRSLSYPNIWPIVLAYFFAVGTVVALISRSLYPLVLKSKALTVTLAGLMAVVVVWGPISMVLSPLMAHENSAPMGIGFFPKQGRLELARGTMVTNPNDGIGSTGFFSTGEKVRPGETYVLEFRCTPHKNPILFAVEIQAEFIPSNPSGLMGAQETLNFKCANNHSQTAVVRFKKSFVPRIMLDDLRGHGQWLPTYAILKKADFKNA